jgi:hypothetical protein
MNEGQVPEKEVEQPAEEEKPPETTEPEKAPPPREGEAQIPGVAKVVSPEDKESTPPPPDEWPDSAKRRVADEAEKRRRAIARADEAERVKDEYATQIADLESRLTTAQRPIVPGNPLSDVHDEASLRKAEEQYEKLQEFAELNRNGAYDVVTGRNPDGSEKREDFTEEEITKMKLSAERALRHLIPERRQYLAARAQMDSAAKAIYPPLQDPSSQWSREAAEILKVVPELERIPDVLVWLGHALYRRDEFVASLPQDTGAPQRDQANDAKRIVENSRTQRAPSVPVDRGFSQRRDADVEAARKTMRSEKTDESMEDYIGAVLSKSRQRRTGSQPVR